MLWIEFDVASTAKVSEKPRALRVSTVGEAALRLPRTSRTYYNW